MPLPLVASIALSSKFVQTWFARRRAPSGGAAHYRTRGSSVTALSLWLSTVSVASSPACTSTSCSGAPVHIGVGFHGPDQIGDARGTVLDLVNQPGCAQRLM